MVASGTQKRKQGDMLGRAHENVAPVVRAVRRAPEEVAFGRAREGEKGHPSKAPRDSIPGGHTALGRDEPAHSQHRRKVSESRRRTGRGGQAPTQPWGLPIWKHLWVLKHLVRAGGAPTLGGKGLLCGWRGR